MGEECQIYNIYLIGKTTGKKKKKKVKTIEHFQELHHLVDDEQITLCR